MRHASLYWQPLPHGRSILLVAQLTPPSPLVGAHRPAALTKYLARRGHRVTVLTSMMSGRGASAGRRSRGTHARPAQQPPELAPGEPRVVAGEESGRLCRSQSDRTHCGSGSVGSRLAAFALPRALALRSSERFDCVITTSPPASAHIVGSALRVAGTPWIADLRDGWTFDPPRPPWPTRPQALLDAALERFALGSADRVVAVTAPIAEDLERSWTRPVAVITNGFDPEETIGRDIARSRPDAALAGPYGATERRRTHAAGIVRRSARVRPPST